MEECHALPASHNGCATLLLQSACLPRAHLLPSLCRYTRWAGPWTDKDPDTKHERASDLSKALLFKQLPPTYGVPDGDDDGDVREISRASKLERQLSAQVAQAVGRGAQPYGIRDGRQPRRRSIDQIEELQQSSTSEQRSAPPMSERRAQARGGAGSALRSAVAADDAAKKLVGLLKGKSASSPLRPELARALSRSKGSRGTRSR